MNKHGFVDNERTGQSFYYKNCGLLEQPKISNYGKVEMFNAFI